MMKRLIMLLLSFVLCAAAAEKESPLACNINAFTPEIRKRHFDVLGPALRNLRTGVRELPNGYEFSFAANSKTFAMLAEWIDQERLCCPFFDIELRVEKEGGPLWLRLTGRPGTKEFIRADAGPWLQQP